MFMSRKIRFPLCLFALAFTAAFDLSHRLDDHGSLSHTRFADDDDVGLFMSGALDEVGHLVIPLPGACKLSLQLLISERLSNQGEVLQFRGVSSVKPPAIGVKHDLFKTRRFGL